MSQTKNKKGTPLKSSGTEVVTQPFQRRNDRIARFPESVKAHGMQVVEPIAKAVTRSRPHEVPSTIPAVIRAGIPGSVRAGRSFRQEGKDCNASQHVVTELYCRAEFRRLEEKINFLIESQRAA